MKNNHRQLNMWSFAPITVGGDYLCSNSVTNQGDVDMK